MEKLDRAVPLCVPSLSHYCFELLPHRFEQLSVQCLDTVGGPSLPYLSDNSLTDILHLS